MDSIDTRLRIKVGRKTLRCPAANEILLMAKVTQWWWVKNGQKTWVFASHHPCNCCNKQTNLRLGIYSTNHAQAWGSSKVQVQADHPKKKQMTPIRGWHPLHINIYCALSHKRVHFFLCIQAWPCIQMCADLCMSINGRNLYYNYIQCFTELVL